MDDDTNEEICLDKITLYKQKNKEFLTNKVIQSFLEQEENEKLFLDAICNPTNENKLKLDHAFKMYYFNIRFTSYISSALYFNAINFDKKHRKIQERHPLTVDKPVGEKEEGTFKDLICDTTSEIKVDNILQSEDIVDYIENPLLCEAVRSLTETQNEILNLAYIRGLSDTEIGLILGKSQQAVSKTHKKALKNIYSFLHRREGE